MPADRRPAELEPAAPVAPDDGRQRGWTRRGQSRAAVVAALERGAAEADRGRKRKGEEREQKY
jgi:hypothetical protein